MSAPNLLFCFAISETKTIINAVVKYLNNKILKFVRL